MLRAYTVAFVAVSAFPRRLNPTCGGTPTDILDERGA